MFDEGGEYFGGLLVAFSGDVAEGFEADAEGVADGDANAFAAVINGENASSHVVRPLCDLCEYLESPCADEDEAGCDAGDAEYSSCFGEVGLFAPKVEANIMKESVQMMDVGKANQAAENHL